MTRKISFSVAFDQKHLDYLRRVARERGVTVGELVRCIVRLHMEKTK